MSNRQWIQTAEELPQGHKTNIECPTNCGSGQKLSVVHDVKSYWCNCYRCGFKDFHDKGIQTLAQRAKIKKLNEEAENVQHTNTLPEDFTKELPRHARMWLFKAGITETVWKENNIGYSASLERVVLPIFNKDGDLIWYQCRALLDGQSPKYIQPEGSKDNCIFVREHTTDRGYIVVVEDILSAIRVGKNITTICLLGTKITTEQAAELSRYSNKYVTWLDSDKAGKDGAYSIRKTLGLIGDTSNISTNQDPKMLSDKEINKQLDNVWKDKQKDA